MEENKEFATIGNTGNLNTGDGVGVSAADRELTAFESHVYDLEEQNRQTAELLERLAMVVGRLDYPEDQNEGEDIGKSPVEERMLPRLNRAVGSVRGNNLELSYLVNRLEGLV